MSVEEEFDNNFKKVLGLFRVDELLKTQKASSEDIQNLTNELLSDKKEEFKAQFKQDIKSLVENKIKFDTEVKEAEKAFKNAVITKKKEYNDEMKKLFSKIHDFDNLIKNYQENLNFKNE